MIKTVNEEYVDAVIRHQIYLMLFSDSLKNKIIQLLDSTEQDISERIRGSLLNHNGLTLSGIKKLESLEKYISTIRLKSWDEIDDLWLKELIEMSINESSVLSILTSSVVPVILDLNLPPPSLLKSLIQTNVFEGKTLKEWSQTIRNSDLDRILTQIKIGMVQGEDSSTIAKRIVGTVKLKGTDGITQITRNNAAAITRTAVNSISAAARMEFNKANKELFSGEIFVATLDGRTSAICRSLDGKLFEVGIGAMPPMHMNCRSLRVAVLDAELLGERPSKPVSEKLLLEEYSKLNKFSSVPKNRDALPFGHKGDFDSYRKLRINELTGQAPARLNYQEWLKLQPVVFQDQILGKAKGKLFRDEGFTLDKFVSIKGTELTLSQIKSLYGK